MTSRRATSTQRLLEMAASQHSVVSHQQIAGCGIGKRERSELVAMGVLRQVYRGVYACPGTALTRWGEAVALSLSCGPNAALSHNTAAAIHDFPGIPSGPALEVSVCGSSHPRAKGAAVHRVTRIEAVDLERRNGLLITTSARTLLDIASRFDLRDLADLVDEGVVRRLWTVDELRAALDRSGGRGRSGMRNLRTVLADREHETLDSRLEQRVIRALRPLRPFAVHLEVIVEGELIILDVAWPELRVAAEIDGFGVHGKSRTKFDRDRRHANLLLAHGWRVVRITSVMADREIVALLGSVLGRGVA